MITMFSVIFIGGCMHGHVVDVDVPADMEPMGSVKIFDRTNGVLSTWEYKRTEWYMGPNKPALVYYSYINMSDEKAIQMAQSVFLKC